MTTEDSAVEFIMVFNEELAEGSAALESVSAWCANADISVTFPTNIPVRLVSCETSAKNFQEVFGVTLLREEHTHKDLIVGDQKYEVWVTIDGHADPLPTPIPEELQEYVDYIEHFVPIFRAS